MTEETQAASTETATEAAKPVLNIPNPDKFHQLQDIKFSFRKVTDEATKVETKRPTIETKLPMLNFDGVVKILTDKSEGVEGSQKPYDLLMGAVFSVYESAIKDFLSDNPSVTSENFPYEKFTWDAIANQPESERKGRGIAKEIWEDFVKSYINVMPGLTGKPKENIERQASIFAQKLNPLKNHEQKEQILPKLKESLTVYINGAGEDAETYAACVEFLSNKADSILNSDKDANLLQNLGF